ncbi:hypothetical protein, partial [Lentzea tibetensis]|uniref:hypothetical protein n=1 Tax=Lentzea tibetensis TaxID=2591470 RepID=UPI001C996062
TLITIAPSPADRTQREHREHKARRHNIDQVNALKTPFDTSHLGRVSSRDQAVRVRSLIQIMEARR